MDDRPTDWPTWSVEVESVTARGVSGPASIQVAGYGLVHTGDHLRVAGNQHRRQHYKDKTREWGNTGMGVAMNSARGWSKTSSKGGRGYKNTGDSILFIHGTTWQISEYHLKLMQAQKSVLQCRKWSATIWCNTVQRWKSKRCLQKSWNWSEVLTTILVPHFSCIRGLQIHSGEKHLRAHAPLIRVKHYEDSKLILKKNHKAMLSLLDMTACYWTSMNSSLGAMTELLL